MTDGVDRRLAAALRAQASGLGAGAPVPPRHQQNRPRLPTWALLALAVLFGAIAGGLAGVISAW